MATTTPVFTTTLLDGPVQRSRGGTRRKVIDLTAAYGAFIMARIGRGGTAALDVGVGLRVNRLIAYTESGSGPLPYADAPGDYILGHPDPMAAEVGAIEAAVSTTISVDAAALATTITPASMTGFAAGDLITIGGLGAYDRWEVNRVNRLSGGGTTLQLDTPLVFAHTAAQADPILNKAEIWKIPVDGGSWVEVLVDYGAATTGDSIDVEIFVQTYANDETS